MIATVRSQWRLLVVSAVVTATVTLLLASVLSLTVGAGARATLREAERNSVRTRELICRISLAVHVSDPRIADICADFLS